jgi:FkbM family methyltransferase
LGYYTLLASKLVGPTGHVFAFEPVPSMATALRRNVQASNLKNVTIIEAALANVSGNLTLHLFDGDHSGCLSSPGLPEGLNK